MKREAYQLDPPAWDRSQRHAYDVRAFDPISKPEELDLLARPWDRVMYVLAGLCFGLAIATAIGA